MNTGSDLFELAEADFDTVLASDIKFQGSICFDKPSMIKGEVTGTIDTPSDLVIDTGAKVKANIKVSRVIVRGSIEGNITGDKDIFVTSTGSLIGDVVCSQLVLEPGSWFCGRCTMMR